MRAADGRRQLEGRRARPIRRSHERRPRRRPGAVPEEVDRLAGPEPGARGPHRRACLPGGRGEGAASDGEGDLRAAVAGGRDGSENGGAGHRVARDGDGVGAVAQAADAGGGDARAIGERDREGRVGAVGSWPLDLDRLSRHVPGQGDADRRAGPRAAREDAEARRDPEPRGGDDVAGRLGADRVNPLPGAGHTEGALGGPVGVGSDGDRHAVRDQGDPSERQGSGGVRRVPGERETDLGGVAAVGGGQNELRQTADVEPQVAAGGRGVAVRGVRVGPDHEVDGRSGGEARETDPGAQDVVVQVVVAGQARQCARRAGEGADHRIVGAADRVDGVAARRRDGEAVPDGLPEVAPAGLTGGGGVARRSRGPEGVGLAHEGERVDRGRPGDVVVRGGRGRGRGAAGPEPAAAGDVPVVVEVVARLRVGVEVVVVVAVEHHLVGGIGTADHHRLAAAVVVAHDVPLVGAVRPRGGVGRRRLDRAEVVAELMGDGAGAAPAPVEDDGVALGRVVGVPRAGRVVRVGGAEAAVVRVGHVEEDQVLAVGAAVALGGELADHGAEVAGGRGGEGDAVDPDDAAAVVGEADEPLPTGLGRAVGVELAGLHGPPAERLPVLVEPARAVLTPGVEDLDTAPVGPIAGADGERHVGRGAGRRRVGRRRVHARERGVRPVGAEAAVAYGDQADRLTRPGLGRGAADPVRTGKEDDGHADASRIPGADQREHGPGACPA
ncbi:MAG: hypothetical protein AVDCRST_MAG48-190 [uncultured Friedmanniella sp.]|uniref:Uncharacterized protein n=1 Tax=uncultured Friedmanniella sp. TaxID=335381 RepID=A0A6J4JT62_9ACTN|nr:MAG: hypothetical protein AVDCRST_MAG48-190 [uncultured Friedmanniella sp.]